jgi:hypothetical protein
MPLPHSVVLTPSKRRISFIIQIPLLVVSLLTILQLQLDLVL